MGIASRTLLSLLIFAGAMLAAIPCKPGKPVFHTVPRSQDSLSPAQKSLKFPLRFGTDKGQHFMLSLILNAGAYAVLTQKWNIRRDSRERLATGIAFSLGVAKELRDEQRPGNHFSWRDLCADALGVGLGLVLIHQP